jgi:predicted nucleic acid-binding Zn ribbon protein
VTERRTPRRRAPRPASGADPKRTEPASLGEALDGYLGKAGLKRRLDQASVVPEWAALVGRKIAEVATPDAVAMDGTLFVKVRSAAWMQELQLMSATILKQLGQHGKKIKRISWRLGS